MACSKQIAVGCVAAALLSLGLAQIAAAQVATIGGAEFRGQLRPVNDARCLARIIGGIGLASCSTAKSLVVFDTLGGRLAFGAECAAVQLPVSQDPWLSGTRLQAVQCSTLKPGVPDRGLWKWVPTGTDPARSRGRIEAAKPPAGTHKCLSLVENPGSLRAVIMDCTEFGVTEFQLTPSP